MRNTKLCVRCLRDTKCYLSYMREDKFIQSDLCVGTMESYINNPMIYSDNLVGCTLNWLTSKKGKDYWYEKYLNVWECLGKYMEHNERVYKTKRSCR